MRGLKFDLLLSCSLNMKQWKTPYGWRCLLIKRCPILRHIMVIMAERCILTLLNYRLASKRLLFLVATWLAHCVRQAVLMLILKWGSLQLCYSEPSRCPGWTRAPQRWPLELWDVSLHELHASYLEVSDMDCEETNYITRKNPKAIQYEAFHHKERLPQKQRARG